MATQAEWRIFLCKLVDYREGDGLMVSRMVNRRCAFGPSAPAFVARRIRHQAGYRLDRGPAHSPLHAAN